MMRVLCGGSGGLVAVREYTGSMCMPCCADTLASFYSERNEAGCPALDETHVKDLHGVGELLS